MNIDVFLGRTKAIGGLMGCTFLCTYFPLPPDGLKAVAPREANALGVEGGFSEVTVIGMIIGLDVEVTFLIHAPFYLKVTNDAGVVGHGVVAIAKSTIDEQALVKETTFEQTFHIKIVPTFLACSQR